MNNLISVGEFEAKVKAIEDIVLIIRAPKDEKIPNYNYKNRAADNTSLSDYINTRLKPVIGDYQFSIYDGNFAENPHGKTSLSRIRKTFE